MINNLKVEYVGNIQLTPEYWDCECSENYIHKKAKAKCVVCGSVPDEQPDSRVEEVKTFLGLLSLI